MAARKQATTAVQAPEGDATTGIKVHVDGLDHTLTFPFTTWEIEFVEDVMDRPISDVDFKRHKALRCLIYLAIRRTDPTVTFDATEPIDINAIDVEEIADRPTGAAEPAANGPQQ